MGAVIGEVLPLALGIAISPIPIIAAILMLLSPKARVISIGFLLGWVIGIVVATAVFTVLASSLPTGGPNGSMPVLAVIQLLLGMLMFVIGIRNWRSRPKPGEEPVLPKWMQAIDKITFPAAFGLAFLLSALNPKNLAMAAGAGTDIGGAHLPTGDVVVVITVFVLLAASTVLVPIVAYLFAADRLRGPLDLLRGWLQKENAVIMALLLLVLGVSMIGKGIGSF